MVTLSTGEMVEAAMVGRDGVVGALAALDGEVSLSRGVVQLGGDGMVCDPDALKSIACQRPDMLSLLIRHEQTVYAQAQQSAACFALTTCKPRLCRWLLRARDLSGSDTLSFTQEYLAEMLGVRSQALPSCCHTLQSAGFIKYSRGKIQIMDVRALREAACGDAIETVKRQYRQLIGRSCSGNSGTLTDGTIQSITGLNLTGDCFLLMNFLIWKILQLPLPWCSPGVLDWRPIMEVYQWFSRRSLPLHWVAGSSAGAVTAALVRKSQQRSG